MSNDCHNCIDCREIRTESLKIAYPESVLCVSRNRHENVKVKKRFCWQKAYVKPDHYQCFRSGGFD